MKNAPKMISTKDLSYLSDIFEWNFTACKKANHYSNEIINLEIKDLFNECCMIHKEIADKIIKILN